MIKKKSNEGFLRGVNYSDPVLNYRTDKIHSTLKKVTGKNLNMSKTFIADTFNTHYLPAPIPKSIHEIPEEKALEYEVFKAVYDSPIVEENRSYTVANSTVSMALTVSFLENLIKELEEKKKSASAEVKEVAEQLLDQLVSGGKASKGSQQAGKKQQSKGKGNEGNQDSQKEQAGNNAGDVKKSVIMEAVTNALKKATEDAKNVAMLQKLVSNNAGVGHTISFEDNIDKALELARNTDVKKILKLLRGMPKLSIAKKKRTVKFSKGEITGYEFGSDLERVVPTELALPDEVFYSKFAESQLLLYERRLKEEEGAIHVLLDKSGSMEGEKIIWAKAVAMALFNKARKENREFYIRFFDEYPHDLVKVPKNVKSEDVLKLVEYIGKVSAGGGTDITRAIVTATEDIRQGKVKGTSDIILITDGEDEISEEKVLKELKRANANLISIGVRCENPSLKKVSTKFFSVYALNEDDIIQIMEE